VSSEGSAGLRSEIRATSEYWLDGLMEYWSTGVVEYWSSGVMEYWSTGSGKEFSGLAFFWVMDPSKGIKL
jgi:hypothetical protein